MKILITGGKGMLGKTLQRELADHDLVIADLPDVDILRGDAFSRLVSDARPGAVIHCAAMTQVDRCEQEPEQAYRINAAGTANVATACQQHGVRLLAISTDYVFKGDLDRPYHEFDRPEPNTVYGKSKYAGEDMVRTLCPNHLIARISWLYGENGPSFVHTMLALADGTRPELTVVQDQIGNPTSTTAVARHLKLLLQHQELAGTFHLTCEGQATWYDFAREIFRCAGVTQRVIPCTTKDFPRPAPRPANSRLDNMMLRLHGLPTMPNWQDALREFLADANH
ncbi:MAG: dTDP-4-dehydrorhamnose reductase [Lentisphaeria bacterium]|nr:dTDP-4-dehydrorhamnose reductase [Lentisphaeria bacterium]